MPANPVILHVDMDAFFASVEQLDHPQLRGRPVLVGGDGPRGVVAAASYEARAFGCHSAQPMATARRQCPQAVVVPPRGSRYRQISDRIFAIFEAVTPLVQPLSIDEAFLDVTGVLGLYGPATTIGADIKRRISSELGLTASVGIGPNKFVAKLASDLNKPDGLTAIGSDGIQQRLAPLPIDRMWGVGPVTSQKLRGFGVHTFGDLQRVPVGVLESWLGVQGRRMAQLARGEDSRPVTSDHQAKSISHEQTFAVDIQDPQTVRRVLFAQVEAVARRLRRCGFRARRVTVKFRFGAFETITRSCSLQEPTQRDDRLWEAALGLFDRWAEHAFAPIRLIGVGAGQLTTSPDQLHLFTHQADERVEALGRLADQIQAKFGQGVIRHAASLPPSRHERSDTVSDSS